MKIECPKCGKEQDVTWTYAPVLDEEPLPRSERLEKLTAERDALLEEDQ